MSFTTDERVLERRLENKPLTYLPSAILLMTLLCYRAMLSSWLLNATAFQTRTKSRHFIFHTAFSSYNTLPYQLFHTMQWYEAEEAVSVKAVSVTSLFCAMLEHIVVS